MSKTGTWEELRKQARQLENEIDIKLVSFSKLGANGTVSKEIAGKSSDDSIPLLASSEFSVDSMCPEIQQLLNKLSEVNDKMADVSSTQAPSAAVQHTIQRHRSILNDYSAEFQKTNATLQSRREREDLLGSIKKDIDAYKSSSGLSRRTDLYLKENEHLRSSERLVDEQIHIAMDTRDHMVSQRGSLKAIKTKMNDLSHRFPLINSLVQRINLRKRRDTIILGSVIGLCTVFLLWYAFY